MNSKQRRGVSWIFVVGMLAMAVGFGTLITQARNDYQEAHQRAMMWRDVVDGSPGGIVVCDREGYVIAWNVGAEQLFGWTEDDVVGTNITFLMPNDAARTRHTEALSDDNIAAELQAGAVRRFDCYAMTKCGHVKHVSVRVSGIQDGYKYFLAHIDLAEKVGPIVVTQEPDILEPAPIQQQRKQF